jgi:hypothetical protein
LHDPGRRIVWDVPMWEDLAAADFLVRIVADKK